MKKAFLILILSLFTISAKAQDCSFVAKNINENINTYSYTSLTSGGGATIEDSFNKIKKNLDIQSSDTLKCTSTILYERRNFPLYTVEIITIKDDKGYVQISDNPIFRFEVTVYTSKGVQTTPEADRGRAALAITLASF